MPGKEGAPKDGSLRLPVDIFDLIFHLMPTILLILKIIRVRAQGSQTGEYGFNAGERYGTGSR